MGISGSILLIAIGAILVWAVNLTVAGIDVNMIGWILMIVGAIGALLSLVFWSRWGGFGDRRTDRERPRDRDRDRVVVER